MNAVESGNFEPAVDTGNERLLSVEACFGMTETSDSDKENTEPSRAKQSDGIEEGRKCNKLGVANMPAAEAAHVDFAISTDAEPLLVYDEWLNVMDEWLHYMEPRLDSNQLNMEPITSDSAEQIEQQSVGVRTHVESINPGVSVRSATVVLNNDAAVGTSIEPPLASDVSFDIAKPDIDSHEESLAEQCVMLSAQPPGGVCESTDRCFEADGRLNATKSQAKITCDDEKVHDEKDSSVAGLGVISVLLTDVRDVPQQEHSKTVELEVEFVSESEGSDIISLTSIRDHGKFMNAENCNINGEADINIVGSDTSDSEVESVGEAETVAERSNIYVKCSNNVDGRRVFDKKHFCMFCNVSSTNLTKHILNRHKSEDYVKQVILKPKKSRERKLLLDKMRYLGDYRHNCEVRSSGAGEIIPWRSPPETVPAESYVPCPDCFAFFQNEHLWRHHKVCEFCPRTHKHHSFRNVRAEAELLLPSSHEISDGLRSDVFGIMSWDEISILAKNDGLIIKFGEKLYDKHRNLKHLHQHISTKMRELARFVIAMRSVDESVTWLSDCLHPSKFDSVIKAVKKVCGYADATNKFQTPSLALKLGHSLKKCCAIAVCVSIKEGDRDKRKVCEDFMFLCDREWSTAVSSAALSTLQAQKMNKPQMLPLTEDIQTLNRYINEESKKCMELLEAGASPETWTNLGKLTLVAIILFNRRRGGEAERLLLGNYLQRNKTPLAIKDISDSLSQVEKTLCSTYCRVEIRGKRGRTVPVILTPKNVKAIDVLNASRQTVGISEENPYVFAKLRSNAALRASDCLRSFAVLCGAKSPENLTSTRLRKHIATTSQILNLQECELDLLAGFLGHDLRVHRQFYRLPEDTLQLAKVSKILLAYDRGDIAAYKGKSMEEIDIGDVDVSEDEESAAGNCELEFSRKMKPATDIATCNSSSSVQNKPPGMLHSTAPVSSHIRQPNTIIAACATMPSQCKGQQMSQMQALDSSPVYITPQEVESSFDTNPDPVQHAVTDSRCEDYDDQMHRDHKQGKRLLSQGGDNMEVETQLDFHKQKQRRLSHVKDKLEDETQSAVRKRRKRLQPQDDEGSGTKTQSQVLSLNQRMSNDDDDKDFDPQGLESDDDSIDYPVRQNEKRRKRTTSKHRSSVAFSQISTKSSDGETLHTFLSCFVAPLSYLSGDLCFQFQLVLLMLCYAGTAILFLLICVIV
jgi:hypothetical protein